jgi:hypothetical protein
MIPFPRAVIGTPEPPATRPKLNRVGVLIAHEVGVLNTSRYRSADPARVLDDARAAAAFGISSNRPWEYSYMIGLDGSVFTQAGQYRAAHCLNFNDQSAGVVFLNALDVPANAAQIAAWHALRAFMVNDGTLAANHSVAPHYRYRSTSCPGLRAEPPKGSWPSPTGQGRLGDLIPALTTAPTPPPTPPTEDDDDMAAYLAIPPVERQGKPWLFVSGSVRPATTFDVNDGVPQRQMNDIPAQWRVQQYDDLHRAAGLG